MGSFVNRPLATVGAVGMTADGQLLTADVSSTPAPAQGEFRTWTFTYTNRLSSSAKTLGFQISVPYTGEQRNVAFDNLRIQFIPAATQAATIFHAVEVCWNSEPNKNYQVQWSPTVAPPVWQDLGLPQAGTGARMCVLDSTRGQAEKVYRIQVWP